MHELNEEALTVRAPVVPGDPDQDAFCEFWRGDDPRLHSELCELLDQEGIPHKTVRHEDRLFRISDASSFQIGIPYSLSEKAEGRNAIFVLPEDEIRAREIVKEVVEGVPPE